MADARLQAVLKYLRQAADANAESGQDAEAAISDDKRGARRLDHRKRYLQIAFNHDLNAAKDALASIPQSDRILIEAGTPFIKREGIAGIEGIREYWAGGIVADLKTMDGALEEVELAHSAGATAATVSGSAPTETLNLFLKQCRDLDMDSMIDMLAVDEPLKVLRRLALPPDVVILHKGRDEEATRGKVIAYKQVTKIRSKYDAMISAAGGVDLAEARSAIFNGASIVVVNIVAREDPWTGIAVDDDIGEIANEFLSTIR